jgi:hypothetical protein
MAQLPFQLAVILAGFVASGGVLCGGHARARVCVVPPCARVSLTATARTSPVPPCARGEGSAKARTSPVPPVARGITI